MACFPGWHQDIIWTSAGMLSIQTLGTNFSEILSNIHTFSFMKMHLKMSSGNLQPFYLGLNVLKIGLHDSSPSNGHQGDMSYYPAMYGKVNTQRQPPFPQWHYRSISWQAQYLINSVQTQYVAASAEIHLFTPAHRALDPSLWWWEYHIIGNVTLVAITGTIVLVPYL